jgi:hypothetical protein
VAQVKCIRELSLSVTTCWFSTTLVGDAEIMGVALTRGKTTLAGPMTLGCSAGNAETIDELELHVLKFNSDNSPCLCSRNMDFVFEIVCYKRLWK